MANIDQLRKVKAGDLPSASQQNIIIEAIKGTSGGTGGSTGTNTFNHPGENSTRPDNQKFSRIAQFKVDEDPPDPPADRTFLMCVEMDGDNVVSEQIPIALNPNSLALSKLYLKDQTLFAGQVIGNFGSTDADGYAIDWMEVIPPARDASDIFPIRVWTDGGSTDGDKTMPCDRTYTVRSLEATDPATGGQLLGVALTPDKRRPPIGKLSIPLATGPGEIGLGYFTNTGGTLTFHLFDANETLDTEAC